MKKKAARQVERQNCRSELVLDRPRNKLIPWLRLSGANDSSDVSDVSFFSSLLRCAGFANRGQSIRSFFRLKGFQFTVMPRLMIKKNRTVVLRRGLVENFPSRHIEYERAARRGQRMECQDAKSERDRATTNKRSKLQSESNTNFVNFSLHPYERHINRLGEFLPMKTSPNTTWTIFNYIKL